VKDFVRDPMIVKLSVAAKTMDLEAWKTKLERCANSQSSPHNSSRNLEEFKVCDVYQDIDPDQDSKYEPLTVEERKDLR